MSAIVSLLPPNAGTIGGICPFHKLMVNFSDRKFSYREFNSEIVSLTWELKKGVLGRRATLTAYLAGHDALVLKQPMAIVRLVHVRDLELEEIQSFLSISSQGF
jgi:hypothetical protein